MAKSTETKTTRAYEAMIEECSIEELTKRDRIALKDTTDATSLDELIPDDTTEYIIKNPTAYAVLSVHNEAADDKDYKKYIIMAGTEKFVTGSESFYRSFRDIFDEMDGEAFDLKCYKKPSNNFKGKFFLTCSIV